MFFAFYIGVAFVFFVALNICYNQYWREPIFVFVFEGVLFVFADASPAFALLFALPPKYTPLKTNNRYIFFTHSK